MDDQDNNFWQSLSGSTMGMDALLQGKKFSTVRSLTDRERERQALSLPAEAGTRVAFVTNLGSVLTYDQVPQSQGTVVMVRTAEGDATSQGSMVFVKFDEGLFIPVDHQHLRRADAKSKQASAFVMRFSNLGDLSAFFSASEKSGDLIRKSTKDLWSCEEQDGEFVLSRLFADNGEPLKG